ncbi:T-cell surface glycoprotein CD5 [Varanus komodoensis]|uniref:T-cell surface glycoprotein CD5 n=1 Tax=Varanus komodoensis TaxID=61221 RepID=UPI001CF7CA6D|nr:T-cell surface glycoprotein CD5 [Varanus komodoensis]
MRRNVPMRVKHLLSFVPLMLVGMWAVTCDGGQSEIPEVQRVRLHGTGSRCSGWLERLHMGKWKRISSKNWTLQNAEVTCKQLLCGVPVGILKPYSEAAEEQDTCLVECLGEEATLEDCIWHECNHTHHLGVTLVCQDPKQTSTVSETTTTMLTTLSESTDAPKIKLDDGTSLCLESVKLNFRGHWETVCLGLQRWQNRLKPTFCQREDCEEAVGLKNPQRERTSPAQWEKAQCEKRNFSLDCLDSSKECFHLTLMKCSGQDSKPNVSNTETVLGVLLGLVLTTLLVICVPPAYKKMVKKYTKKKQHQWIGPSGMSQNVSFHRNSSATLQSRPESHIVQEEENKALKKNSYLSPYAALERATNRTSSPLDNSSDSDYDLNSAQQV